MDGHRVGRAIRALRHRNGWTQAELASRAGCSASVISRLERGNTAAAVLPTIERVVDALGGRLVLFVEWRGGELDRLFDADHAALQERWATAKPARWAASRQEVTYNHFGERGSIDDLAFDPIVGTLLVTELKTGLYDIQRLLAKIDERERLGRMIASRFGWEVRRVVSCLVVADSTTNRRRVRQHGALFGRFDCRGRAATTWLAHPTSPASGLLLFLPLSNVRGTHGRRAGRRRVRHSAAATSVNHESHSADTRS